MTGEWWKKKNVMDIAGNADKTGGEPAISNAYTINGQPGYLYPCSKPGKSLLSFQHKLKSLFSYQNGTKRFRFFFVIPKQIQSQSRWSVAVDIFFGSSTP